MQISVSNSPVLPKKLEEDPVARSLAKPDAFAKPAAAIGQHSSANKGPVRVRTMNWKRGVGRPRKTVRDKRDVKFY